MLRVLDVADVVVEDPDLDARLHAFDERVGDARGQLVLLPDEVLHVDELLGGRDVGDQGVEVLCPGFVEVARANGQHGGSGLAVDEVRDGRGVARAEAGHELLGAPRGGGVDRGHERGHEPPLLWVVSDFCVIAGQLRPRKK